MRFPLLLLLLLDLVGMSFPAHARWVEPYEVASKEEKFSLLTRVASDGSYTYKIERQLLILKPNARDKGMVRLNFNSTTSTFRLLEAETIVGEERIKVRPEHVEIKPLASSGPGFDANSQATIAFPRIEVGSRIRYRYEVKVRKPLVPGYFSSHYQLGWDELTENFSGEYESELPLYVRTHDPEGYLEVKQREQKGKHLLSVRLKRPILKQVVQEPNSLMEGESLPWISISSVESWKQFSPALLQAWRDRINSPLPDSLAKLGVGLAEKPALEQIGAVVARLGDRLRYVGDWVPVEGGYFPRPFPLVAETGFGDCKDFSAVTASLLRQLGFDAYVAFVKRQREAVFSPLEDQNPLTNHAIVYAVKDGKEYWVDPTNDTSLARFVRSDIAGRAAIVLGASGPEIKNVPAMRGEDERTGLKLKIQLRPDFTASVKADLAFEGRAALWVTGWGLSFSQSQTDFYLMRYLFPTSRAHDWKFSPYDLSSRETRDFYTSAEFSGSFTPVETPSGRGIRLPEIPDARNFEFRREGKVAQVKLGDPSLYEREITLTGKKLRPPKRRVCEGSAAWADYSQRITNTHGGWKIVTRFLTKKDRLTMREIRSPEFARFQLGLVRCLEPVLLVE